MSAHATSKGPNVFVVSAWWKSESNLTRLIAYSQGHQSFESFSEDPTLSGRIAAAYVEGLQQQGVGACIKHFVANDQEDDRQGVSAEVSPRALREIYLMPFMLAEKFAKPWYVYLSCLDLPFIIRVLGPT